jgi:hypothetical protein
MGRWGHHVIRIEMVDEEDGALFESACAPRGVWQAWFSVATMFVRDILQGMGAESKRNPPVKTGQAEDGT